VSHLPTELLALRDLLAIQPQQLEQLQQATANLTSSQLVWLSGYLFGISQNCASQDSSTQQQSIARSQSASIAIIYASQTGNAQGLAEQFYSALQQLQLDAELLDIAKVKGKKLASYDYVFLFASTYGDGEPPESAETLHQWLASDKAQPLPNLKYAVFGLGDSSYEFFCQTGKDFDGYLAQLGATSLLPCVDADLDYQDDYQLWQEQALAVLSKEVATTGSQPIATAASVTTGTIANQISNQVTANVNEVIRLTSQQSPKDISHIEYEFDADHFNYQPGDAIAITPQNSEELVAKTLDILQLDGDSKLASGDSIHDALTNSIELTQVHPNWVKWLAAKTKDTELQALTSNQQELFQWLKTQQVPAILQRYQGQFDPIAAIEQLKPIKERLYSIASSQALLEDELHLTIARVGNDLFTRGAASNFLADAQSDAKHRLTLKANPHFRLPTSSDTPIIMIGAGTGIAPYRAFLQQREADGITNNAWLVFGNTHFQWDFLYQTEIQQWLQQGTLSNLSLAFSRDQAEKVYVQHRLLEQGKQLFDWLERGAHFYICGDKNRMAKDVEQALIQVIEQHHTGDSTDYLQQLKASGRYQKDVY